jgi:hypothetical protein
MALIRKEHRACLPQAGKAHSKYGSTKSQINFNHPNSKQNLFGHSKLEFGAYLGFACLR